MNTQNNDIMSTVRFDQVPIEIILTGTQLKYYREYFKNSKSMADISIMYGVDISTVCRVLKNARKRIIEYYNREG